MSLKNKIRHALGCKYSGALAAGVPAPPISLTSASGEKLLLAEALKKGPVVAAFFKVNCPTCQFTFPFLERMYEACGDSKITFWGISQNDAADTREFAQEYGVRFPLLVDDDGYPASNQYRLTNVPSIFVISSDGTIEGSSVGFAKTDLEKIAAQAADAVGKPLVPLFKPGEVIPDYKPG